MKEIKKFWTFVRERETIRVRRERGDKPPFTEDERLMNYWFPNIRRSDDPATVWLHAALLRHLDEPQDLVEASVAFRLFGGWVPTGELLAPIWYGSGYWEAGFLEALGGVEKPSNPHVPRQLRTQSLAAAAASLEAVHAADGFVHLLRGATLQEAHRALSRPRGIGPEMAYEVVCDLRRTKVLEAAPDRLSWALPSVSAVKGASLLLDRELGPARRGDQQETIETMQRILEEGREEFPDWELSEAQRALSMFHTWASWPKPARRKRWK